MEGRGGLYARPEMKANVFCRSADGVAPFEFGETGEIRIGRGQFATMFDGQGRQMGVGNQIGDRLSINEHLLKYFPVAFSRTNDFCTGLFQPALDAIHGLFEGEGFFEDSRICSYSDKCGQNRPAQTNSLSPGELFIPPCAGFGVAWMQ